MCLWFDLLIQVRLLISHVMCIDSIKLHLKLGRARVQTLETISAKHELGRSYFRAIDSRNGSELEMHWERVCLAILITQVSLILTPARLLFTLVNLKPSG